MDNLGTEGIVSDLKAHALPLDTWSAGQNVRFNDNEVIKFLGDKEVFSRPSVPPYFAMPVQTADDVLWLYAGLSKVYASQTGGHTNITRIKTSPEFTVPRINLTITTSVPSVVVP
jgi:hypothetical protein